jgi:ABC-type nitrate/sulfonate/bicarbonate transport system permease component
VTDSTPTMAALAATAEPAPPPVPKRGASGQRGRQLLRLLPSLAVPVVLLVIWQVYCSVADVDPTVLPTPSRVVDSLFAARDIAWTHTWQTLQETLIGFSVSIVFALVVAVAMDQIMWLRRSLYPMLVASQTIPVIAIAPLMIIWFGFGLLPKVLVIVLVTFFPIVVAVLDGFAATEREAMNLLKTMGATRMQTFRLVRFPGALPFLFTGLRISATYAVIAAIFAEYVGAYTGLGIWMSQSKNAFRTDLVFGAITISALVSVLFFLLVAIAARLVMPWYYAAREQSR